MDTPKLAQPKPSALDRLSSSRLRLREALLDIAHPPKPEPLMSHGIAGIGDEVLHRLRRAPLAALAIKAAEGWWHDHPLNKAGTVAVKASMSVVRPYANKDPLKTFAIAAGATVVLLALKPWRLLFRPKIILSVATGIVFYALRTTSPRDWLGAVLPPQPKS